MTLSHRVTPLERRRRGGGMERGREREVFFSISKKACGERELILSTSHRSAPPWRGGFWAGSVSLPMHQYV